MTNREVIIALVSSILSGLTVWLIQQSYSNRRERRRESEQLTVRAKNKERVVSGDIFYHLAPGKDIAFMTDMLGVPNKHSRIDQPVFSEKEEEKTNSYLYVFKNAFVKVTSKDNEAIDILTVISPDGSITLDTYLLLWIEGLESGRLGELIVPSTLIEMSDHTFLQSRHDASFALGFYTGNPSYLYHTFFGFGGEKSFEYHKSEDPQLFLGGTIEGVCLSASKEDSYFIYQNEL